MSVLLRELDGVLNAMNTFYTTAETEVAAYHLSSTDDSYNLDIPLIGVSKDDLSVEIKDNFLHVSAKTKVKSIYSKDYKKSFQLHKDTDVESVSAKLENGLLTISVAKIKPAKRTINVNVV